MKVIDAHCDVLWRLWDKQYVKKELDGNPFYDNADWLQVTKAKLEKGGVHLQACALYVSEDMVKIRPFETALEMIEIFYQQLVSDDTIVIQTLEDLYRWKEGNKLGLLLTLEGAEAVEGDLVKLYTLHRLGVRWIGLTHNPANQVADGVGERRGAGLSNFGRQFVSECNRLKIGIDVSHLSERGFWDVVELSTQPIFATHSNTKAQFDHRRNLTDDQIKAILEKQGVVGLTFVPYFTSANEEVTIDDLLKHVDHVCSLGGEKYLGFGSDFDGITHTYKDLTDSGDTYHLINALLKHYTEDQVKGFMGENWFQLMVRLWS